MIQINEQSLSKNNGQSKFLPKDNLDKQVIFFLGGTDSLRPLFKEDDDMQ